jgi:flagellar biosynthesis chaperone FliJ
MDNYSRLLKPIKQVFHLPLDNLEELSEEEIEQYAYQLSKEQMGCRFLQKKLDECQQFGSKLYHKVYINF